LAALDLEESARRFAAVAARAAALRDALGERRLEIGLRLFAREPLAAEPGDGLAAALDLLGAALASEDEGTGGPPWAGLGWIAAQDAAEPVAVGPALERLLAYGPRLRLA